MTATKRARWNPGVFRVTGSVLGGNVGATWGFPTKMIVELICSEGSNLIATNAQDEHIQNDNSMKYAQHVRRVFMFCFDVSAFFG